MYIGMYYGYSYIKKGEAGLIGLCSVCTGSFLQSSDTDTFMHAKVQGVGEF